MATHLLLKRGRYYFRRRLPRPLAKQINISKIVRALPPCSRSRAIVYARSLATISDQVFHIAMLKKEISNEEFDELIRSHFSQFQIKYEDQRNSYDASRSGDLEKSLTQSRDALKYHDTKGAAKAVHRILEKAGYEIDEDTQQFKDFTRKLLRTFAEATRIEIQRSEGNYAELPKDPLFLSTASGAQPQAQTDGIKLSDAYDKYTSDKLARNEWRSEAIRENKNSFDLALEWLGDQSLSRIARPDVSGYREILQLLPKHRGKTPTLKGKSLKALIAMTERDTSIPRVSAPTVAKHMKNLNALLGWAERQGYINENPAKGVYVASTRKSDPRDDRQAWQLEHLHKWFSSPFYRGCKSAQRRRQPGDQIIRDHFFWMPLLALYHPIRAEEVAQMFVADIKHEAGILFMDIDGGLDIESVKASGKQIKSIAARRRIPIHNNILELGFEAFVNSMKKPEATRLFEGLKPGGAASRYSQYFCRRFGEHIRYFGIQGVSYHGLRHTAITALSEGHPNTDINDELAGHKISGERGRYRKGASLKALAKAINSIEYRSIWEILNSQDR